jgi:hypothetical protein
MIIPLIIIPLVRIPYSLGDNSLGDNSLGDNSLGDNSLDIGCNSRITSLDYINADYSTSRPYWVHDSSCLSLSRNIIIIES